MRREPRPFVVEVRRGQKKPQPTPPASPMPPSYEAMPDDEMMRRAEAALFGRAEPPQTGPSETAAAPRRILEVVPLEQPPVLDEQPIIEEPKRRGRKPGSKNRPKLEMAAAAAEPEGEKRRRGRPRKHPEGEVRSVAVTPELASAALQVMARAQTPPAPVSPVPVGTTRPASASAAPAVKRPRGRPRKHPLPVVEASPAPSFAPQTAVERSDAAAPAQQAPVDSKTAMTIVDRYGPDRKLRIGQRWTRRLRGFANPDHIKQRVLRP